MFDKIICFFKGHDWYYHRLYGEGEEGEEGEETWISFSRTCIRCLKTEEVND